MANRGLVLETVAASRPGRLAVKKDAICTILEQNADFYLCAAGGSKGYLHKDKVTVATSFLPTANYEANSGDVSVGVGRSKMHEVSRGCCRVG